MQFLLVLFGFRYFVSKLTILIGLVLLSSFQFLWVLIYSKKGLNPPQEMWIGLDWIGLRLGQNRLGDIQGTVASTRATKCKAWVPVCTPCTKPASPAPYGCKFHSEVERCKTIDRIVLEDCLRQENSASKGSPKQCKNLNMSSQPGTKWHVGRISLCKFIQGVFIVYELLVITGNF